jgi:hypothetical protein
MEELRKRSSIRSRKRQAVPVREELAAALEAEVQIDGTTASRHPKV